jgi:SAM-dependent methyltransferase
MCKCNCCYSGLEELNIKSQLGGGNLFKCPVCSHIQLGKIPSAAQIAYYYNGEYSEKRNSYLGAPYFNIMRKRAEAQYRYMSRYIDLNGKNFLDAGCGYGFLLEKLSLAAKNSFGCEFDSKAADFCSAKNLRVVKINGESEIAGLLEPGMIVTFSHVLEHLIDWDETLKTLAKNRCCVFFEVPAYELKYSSQFDDQEGHINFFNQESAKKFFINRGFEIINISGFGPSIDLFYGVSFLRRKFLALLRYLTADYFYNRYDTENKNGIWIRLIVKPS